MSSLILALHSGPRIQMSGIWCLESSADWCTFSLWIPSDQYKWVGAGWKRSEGSVLACLEGLEVFGSHRSTQLRALETGWKSLKIGECGVTGLHRVLCSFEYLHTLGPRLLIKLWNPGRKPTATDSLLMLPPYKRTGQKKTKPGPEDRRVTHTHS